MSWIDISIIGLAVLFGLFGVKIGLKKSAVEMGAFAVAFVLAFVLAGVVAESLLGIDGVKNFVLGDGVGADCKWSLANLFYAGIENGRIPAEDGTMAVDFSNSFYAPILERVTSAPLDAEITENAGMAIYLAFLLFSAICGVGIFIVLRFVLVIVTVIVKSYIDKPKMIMSRLLGFAVGVVHGGALAFAITVVFACFCGCTFVPAFDKVYGEYNHTNAVICDKFYDAAIGMRNKMLPSSDMYGRIVNIVYQKEVEQTEKEKLARPRLDLFVSISNLNYTSQPWSINSETNCRVFDEEAAEKIGDYANVGFDAVIKAIASYNEESAKALDDTSKFADVDNNTFERYIGFVETNSTSIQKTSIGLKTALDRYVKYYEDGLGMTGEKAIGDQNINLKDEYTNIRAYIIQLQESYAHIAQLFGELTDLEQLMPECKVLSVPAAA